MTSPGVRRALVGTAIYLVVLGALLGIVFVLAQSDVVAKGEFVDVVDHDVIRLRVMDRWTIYTDQTFVPFSSDLATSFVLMAITGMALLAFALTATGESEDRRLPRFFLLTAIGTTFLAFDEQAELVDSLGYNVEALYVPDLFLYAPPLALFAWVFRRILSGSRPALALLVVGVSLFGLAQGFDRLPHDRFEGYEERLEILATLFLAGGIVLLVVHHLGGRARSLPTMSAASEGASTAATATSDTT